ncbi:MAG: GHKL domain-containing protein [Ferruginibacter sp.]|nr:GHKL domain-containing protein [Ferruginibacter sp.]
MNPFTEFFKGIFSTSQWPARWHCGYWSGFHGWLYIISDLMIWTAYFLIPILIINYFTQKKEKIRFKKVYLLFAAFILLCGTTHFLDAMMFWIPMYRFNGLVRLLTGIVSLMTVYYLVKALPQLSVQKTNVELENEIALRKVAEQKLEEANRGLKAFASIASHDLQEPLRKIAVFTSMLDERDNNNLDNTSKEYIKKIMLSSQRMQSLVKDILTLSSLNEGIALIPVDLNNPLKNAVENLELKIRETNATIKTGRLPVVKGNENYLAQLFYNLIGNGLKFSKTIPKIEITAETNHQYSYIHVKDNGIGIRQENYDKIFESLQRLHSKTEYEGNGLGLAICKKIADLHHATISVSSKENEGTIFTIRFENS